MSEVKISDLAKKLKRTQKAVLDFLKELGVTVKEKGKVRFIDSGDAETVVQLMQEKKTPPPAGKEKIKTTAPAKKLKDSPPVKTKTEEKTRPKETLKKKAVSADRQAAPRAQKSVKTKSTPPAAETIIPKEMAPRHVEQGKPQPGRGEQTGQARTEETPKPEAAIEKKSKTATLEPPPPVPEAVSALPAQAGDRQVVSPPAAQQEKINEVGSTVSVRDLASYLNISPAQLVKDLVLSGLFININQSVGFGVAQNLGQKYGMTFVEKTAPSTQELAKTEVEDERYLVPKPPVVTVMGHVDHGKTKLLDSIRKTKVTEGEAGGITQHIGAYQVVFQGKKIIFLDTPGHEAFTAMRARGAKITDIIVLVVAANDGVMPQTVEAIHHAQAAGVPIVVAVNKIDLPEANVERTRRQLADIGLVPEEWGGQTVFVNVSAKAGRGIDELLEMTLLHSEVLELKVNQQAAARGTVVEAKLDTSRGPVATVLLERGTLRVGDSFVAGEQYGRVRAMFDEFGKRLKEVAAVTPVEISGLNGVPQAGDILTQVKNEKEAREFSQQEKAKREQEVKSPAHVSLGELHQQIQEGKVKELNLIVKADVQGSEEAIQNALSKLSSEEVKVRVIHSGVGNITESDILLASASNAVVIGFHTKPTTEAARMAKMESIDIRTYEIIYDVVEDIKKAAVGLLPPVLEPVFIGKILVKAQFKVPKIGVVAGCHVAEGKVTRGASVKVFRANSIIHEGKITSLKRFRDDVKEVQAGFECGIGVDDFQSWQVGDMMEAFTLKEMPRGTGS